MKYKVGDRFEIKIERINNEFDYPYETTGGFSYSEYFLDRMRRPDEKMTAEEAWEIARKFCNMEGERRMQILGEKYYHMAEAYEDFTPQQAKAKIEAWEAAQEIKVGDVVRSVHNPEIEVVITRCYYHDGKYYDGINASGTVHSGMFHKAWKKTGRHIDIQGVLEQIGGTE